MLPAAANQALIRLLAPRAIIVDPGQLIAYEADAGQDRGMADAVVFPETSSDVVRLVQWAAEHGVPLVARGAGTGFSGGAVSEQGGIIVEFSRMTRIAPVDRMARTAVVEPGVANQALDEFAGEHGLYYPPDPASGRVCTLGGNVAENAGGPHCFKYGVTTNYVVELEVVLADGRLIRLGGRALDHPGYDLCGLVTGSEGTLALVTAITVRLRRRPPEVKTMMAAFESLERAGAAVSAVIAAGLTPATLEMMDRKIVRIVEDFAHPGLPTDAAAVLIAEVDGYPASLDAQMVEIAAILRREGARHLRIAESAAEREQIWMGRKNAIGAMARLAPAYLLVDCTVPRSRLAETLGEIDRICESCGLQAGHVFHAGDGNLHPLIPFEPDAPRQVEGVSRAARQIMETVVDQDGTITGEHGVGIAKRDYMPLMYTGAELGAMRDVKEVFDPRGLLNPGKIFPAGLPPAHVEGSAPEVPADPFAPATAEEAAHGLAALSAARRPVWIRGGGTKSPAVPDGTVQLLTERLAGIRRYARDDLYVVAGAGTRPDALQAELAGDRMWVPLVSPWPESTIGGIIASNTNGPLRMRHGGVRDLVLAATVALPDGRVVRAGRPVVKNVAGYDLPRVLIGSYGTLGVIVDVTLKCTPLPRTRRTLLVPVEDLMRGLAWGARMLSCALVASAIVLCKECDLAGVSESSCVLAYTAEGSPEDVEAELAVVREVLRGGDALRPVDVDTVSGTDVWLRALGDAADAVVVRTGVPAADLATCISRQRPALEDGGFVVDMAGGLVYATFRPDGVDQTRRWLAALREPAAEAGGYAVVMHAPPPWWDALDRWGNPPEALDLMRGLKRRWDPACILGARSFVVDAP